MRIRGRLRALVGKGKKLPATVVETCGSIRKVSNFVVDMRNGKICQSNSADDLKLMLDLVDEYSHFIDPQTH